MGVETFRVEWGKPPELEKSYGRWPKSVEDDLWPLEDNHFGTKFCMKGRCFFIIRKKNTVTWYNFCIMALFSIHLIWKRNFIFFTYPNNLTNHLPHLLTKTSQIFITKVTLYFFLTFRTTPSSEMIMTKMNNNQENDPWICT